jgi:hypothetical protein
MPTVTALRTYQVGIQSAADTPVAATTKLAVEEFNLMPIDLVHRPKMARGLAIANRGNGFVTRRGTGWVARGPVVWDQFQLWMQLGIEGGLTAVGASTPWAWTATANPLVVPASDFATFERRRTDGSSPVDEEISDGVASTIRLSSAGADNRVDMEITGFGRKLASSTLTASQAMPAIHSLPMALSSVDIDDTWAELGDTAVAAQVLEWAIVYTTGFFPVYTADGITNLDFTEVGFNPDLCNVEIEMTLRVAAQMALEKTAAEAVALRAVRLNFAGAASRAMTFDALVEHEAGSLADLGTQDGEDIVRLRMVGASDDTNFVEVVLTNTTDQPDGTIPV